MNKSNILLCLLNFFIVLVCNSNPHKNGIYDIIKTADSLKQNYLFDELNVLINRFENEQINDDKIKFIIADWAYFQMNYSKADSLADEILKSDPFNINALNLKAFIAFDNGDIANSNRYIERSLLIDSLSIPTLLNYANINLRTGNSKKYIRIIDRILNIDSLNSDALYGKGHYLCRYEYDLINGINYLNKSVVINPLNRKAHNFLGRGYSFSNYSDENIIDEKNVKIDSLLMNNQFDIAHQIISERYLKDSNNINTLKLLAATEYHLGNYQKCIDYSFKILKLNPNYGLAHYFVSESLLKMEEKYNLKINEFRKEYLIKKVDKNIPYLDKVFINYNQCDSILQKSICLNITPFKGYLEALYISGATLYFKDFHHLLWNCPFLENTKGTYTADMRLTDDIGGQGGYHTSSEKILQSASIYGGYNIAFHEFAHQIHWLFTKNDLLELKQLFINAKNGNYTLDWYADMNEREYFAQGVEAYLSEYKLPRQASEYSHTREELKIKDKKLYDFIEKLTKKESFEEYKIQAYIIKSQNAETNELAKKYLEEGLNLYPDNADLLIELGNIFLYDGNIDTSIAIHTSISRNNPSNIYASIALSYDYFKENNITKAIKLLTPFYVQNTQNIELLQHLSYYYITNNEFEKAIAPLEKLIQLDPFPDPYSMPIADTYYLMGKCKKEIKQFQLAENYLIRSIKNNATNIDAYFELIMVEIELNKKEQAIKYFETFKKLKPSTEKISTLNNLLNE